MNKRNLFLWSLYDFANSIIYISFVLYFAQWIVIDGGLSDFWYNALFAIATILLFFSAPQLAALTDKHGGRKYFLSISTILTAIFYGFAAILAGTVGSSVVIIAILFLIGQYFYQLSFVFYNPMLAEIADKEHRAKASGLGQLANSLGQAVGVLIALPFAATRTGPLLPSVIAFFLCALPLMLWYKENKPWEKHIPFSVVRAETFLFKKKVWAFFATSVAAPVLIAFFFFNDAFITVTNNYSLYMQRVFEVSDTKKSILLLLIIAMSSIGGIIAGWISTRIGLLRTLKYLLLLWAIALPVIAFTTNFILFATLTAFVGLLIGSTFSTTRAYLSTILKEEEMGYGFSFYTICERFANLFGPISWGLIVTGMHASSTAYRTAMSVMTVFVIVGLVLVSKWTRETKTETI